MATTWRVRVWWVLLPLLQWCLGAVAQGPGGAALDLDGADRRTAWRMLADSGLAVGIDRDDALGLRAPRDDDQQIWHLTSLGTGLFRIHNDSRGARWSLAGRADGSLLLVRTGNLPEQIWRISPAFGRPDEMLLMNLGPWGAPRVLVRDRAGRLRLAPPGGGPAERWRFARLGPRWPTIFDEYRFHSREVRPNAELPDAHVELTNSHSKELWVLLTDRSVSPVAGGTGRLPGSAGKRIKIPAGKSTTIDLARDAGATLVEVFERVTPFGVERDEWTVPLPPVSRYDLSVYEVIVQSVAIDATVPGGKLEDVQYAPRSLGWFELPAGKLLGDGPLDVYVTAKDQKNPGQVRRIDPRDWQSSPAPTDPVEAALERVKKKAKP